MANLTKVIFIFSNFFATVVHTLSQWTKFPSMLDKAKTILIFVFGDAVKTIKSIQAKNVSRID